MITSIICTYRCYTLSSNAYVTIPCTVQASWVTHLPLLTRGPQSSVVPDIKHNQPKKSHACNGRMMSSSLSSSRWKWKWKIHLDQSFTKTERHLQQIMLHLHGRPRSRRCQRNRLSTRFQKHLGKSTYSWEVIVLERAKLEQNLPKTGDTLSLELFGKWSFMGQL